MWTILKFDKKNINLLKKDFISKLGDNFKFYLPKIQIQKKICKKIKNYDVNLLGNYIFCYHEKFEDEKFVDSLKYTRGLKYFIRGHKSSQDEIYSFIEKCKKFENEDGYLSSKFFDLVINKKYKFISGPFADLVFSLVNFEKTRFDILIGNIKTTLKSKNISFKPI